MKTDTSTSPQLRSAIRHQVFSVLAHLASSIGAGPFKYKQVFLMAADGLLEKKLIERPDFLGGRGAGGQQFNQLIKGLQPNVFPAYGLPGSVSNHIRLVIWELYLQRIIYPTSRMIGQEGPAPYRLEESFLNLNEFQITSYGLKLLIENEKLIRVYDADDYLSEFQNSSPPADPEMVRYLEECISVFGDNYLLASVVLLGVASERLIETLAENLKNKLGESEGNNWYSRYKNKEISKKFNSIINKIRDTYKHLDMDSDEFKAAELTFHNIRIARNNVAHPRNWTTTKIQVTGLIYNFVQYFLYINKINKFLQVKTS